MISINLQGRHGNQLWKYAVCRTVAEHNGYEFHIPRSWMGLDLFNCSLGVSNDMSNQILVEHPSVLYDPNLFKIPDFSRIHGYVQSEQYIIHNKKNIQQWFTLTNCDYSLLSVLDDNTCVINFRGGDYKNLHVYLHVKFYYDSINHIQNINPSIKFLVITDDVVEAKKYFPQYPVYDFGTKNDFLIVSQARYLIIANSSFSWWAAWLNNRSLLTIAPKYWLGYNHNTGWWSPASSITTGFLYVDINGELFTSNQCIQDSKEFDPNLYPFS